MKKAKYRALCKICYHFCGKGQDRLGYAAVTNTL